MTHSLPSGTVVQAPPRDSFYRQVLRDLVEQNSPFLVAGGYALAVLTGLDRITKDLDVFTTPAHLPDMIAGLRERGHIVTVPDARWIAKVHSGEEFVDIIFRLRSSSVPVGEDWFQFADRSTLFGVPVSIIHPTELVWSKIYVQDRYRHDASDIAHVILKQSHRIDWNRLLARADADWELLLAHLMTFQWTYPGERDKVPAWLIRQLMFRLEERLNADPLPGKVCRGSVLSPHDYRQDIEQWGFTDGAKPA